MRCEHVATALAQAWQHRVTYRIDSTHLFCLPAVLTCFTCLLPYDQKSRDRFGFENDRANSSLSRQTSLSEDRQCCESWRDAELGVCAVCAVRDRLETRGEREWVTEWYDWRSPGACPLSRSTVFSPRRDTAVSCLTNDTSTTSSSSTDRYDDWRQASPTVRR